MATTSHRTDQAPAHIRRLSEQVAEAAADPRYARLKDMWTQHHGLKKVSKPPVYVGLYVFPDFYSVIWQELISPGTLVSRDPLERDVEIQLRQRLYKHEHIPDDDVLLPIVWVKAVPTESGDKSVGRVGSVQLSGHTDGSEAARLWGLPFLTQTTDTAGGAYKVDPVVKAERDIHNLLRPAFAVDQEKTDLHVERAEELVDGLLDVKVVTDEVGFAPSETVVSLMGIESILYGVIDNPDFVHMMMEIVTDGTIEYHRQREEAGAVEIEQTWGYRAHYEELALGQSLHHLANGWLNVSAQSLCGLSPAMYAEFLQPYHASLTAAFGDTKVYYHACEPITKKIPVIRELPNLRRLHISPWTDLEVAVEQVGENIELETEVHTADTIFVHTSEEMRKSLGRLLDVAGHRVMDVNLTALETVGENPSVLTTWAQIAQEVTAKYS